MLGPDTWGRALALPHVVWQSLLIYHGRDLTLSVRSRWGGVGDGRGTEGGERERTEIGMQNKKKDCFSAPLGENEID